MSPTRVFMASGRKLLVFVFCSLASIIYLTFLIFNFKDEIRLLEENSASLKQKQDNLAAQLQVSQEQKSRLQNQVDLGIKSLKVLKDEFVAFRMKSKKETESLKGDHEKKVESQKRNFDLTKGELDDLTQEHAKLLEANKLTMEECEREAEEKNKAIQSLQSRREEDQVALNKEAKRTKAEIATLNENINALQAVNADLKESLSMSKSEVNRLRKQLLQLKENPKNINSQANDAFIHSPVNDTKTDTKNLRLNADSDVITKRLGAVNTGGHQSHNLEVPSINNNNNNNHLLPPRGVVDHKDIQNPQIAKPVGVADMNANNAHANSPGMMLQNAVIPKDQENIQIAHPWAKRLSHESHDSGFKVVGQPVLAEPRLDNDADGRKTHRNLPFVNNNNNLGVIVEPRLGGSDVDGKKANVIPYADRDRQVVAPNVGVQVDNPLEAEGNLNSLHQPQLQLNAPDGDIHQVGDARQAVGNDDDDEDHAFGNDKDYGAGALDKPDRGNHGGAVDDAAVVGAAPPEFDDQKVGAINVDFKRRKRKFA